MKSIHFWILLGVLLSTFSSCQQGETKENSSNENTDALATEVANNELVGITPQAISTAWESMAVMVVETAKLMPAELYSYSPTEPLATFGALVGHTAGANYLFAPTVNAKAPELPELDTNDKDAVIQRLEDSFKFIKAGVDKLSQQDLEEEIEWFGSKMSRMQAILTMTDHLQREHGKTITYVRLKGIAPARSAGW